MPRRKSRSPITARAVILLAVLGLVLFGAVEVFRLWRSERGQILAARWLGRPDDPRITRLVGRHLRTGLEAARIPRDSVSERTDGTESDSAHVQWRVGLPPDASLLQANFAVTRSLEGTGLRVLEGRERYGRSGDAQVVLNVGFGKHATHQVVLSRMPADVREETDTQARLALVVFGLAEDPALAKEFLALRAPFAVSLPPATPNSAVLFKEARDQGREVLLQVPLEPINYPQVNPGPGTILVTMKPSQITALLRRYLDQARPVAAVANLMGSLATQDMTVMGAMYRELHRQRLPFLHVMPVPGAVCKPLAADLGVAYEEPDAVIDYETRGPKADKLERRWKQVLEAARARGQMVVMVRASDLSRGFLPKALETKRLEGVSLVPLSSILKRPSS